MKIFTARFWAYLSVVLLVVISLVLFTPYFEVFKPDIRFVGPVDRVGQVKTVTINVSDPDSGLRHVGVSIAQHGIAYTLASLDFPEQGTNHKSFAVEVNPRSLKLHDGEALITVTAADHSLFGNTARLEQRVVIDQVPPQISLLSSYHNISPGGSCLAVYSVSKETEKSGIAVGGDFFPGYPAVSGDNKVYLAFFPVPLNPDKGSLRISVYARDPAGNEATALVPYHLKPRRFRSDSVEVSDAFLSKVVLDFQQQNPSLRGKSPVETFVYINETLREENSKAIQAVCTKTSAVRLWQGPFLRMKEAAPMALFGDRRTYTHHRQKIGESIHLGVDLASTAHAPIEAANSGVVVFSGNLGIYGNTVVIDHGLGIFSLYAHMSELKAVEGRQVAKGDVIGTSGESGFAGGDHLHFSILVGGRFVDPVEWWDPHWITDNVEKKLPQVS